MSNTQPPEKYPDAKRPDFFSIGTKWQQAWAKEDIFKTDLDGVKPKFYCLEMFPYPSAYGLHMGHSRNFTMGDVVARYKRMQGFDVLYPMGYDAFGLPAENAAIKNKTHPKTYTDNAIASISKQQHEMGNSYDWNRMIATCRPEYYKWNQWIFLQFFKRGLAYRKEAPINWCPKCATVLANEQVKDSKCWRCDSIVEVKDLEQWFLKITEYADDLLAGLAELEWPEKIKIMQENWIGKSTGTSIEFELAQKEEGLPDRVKVFTTRPDTIMGVTFITFAPEHPLIAKLIKGVSNEHEIREFINKVVISEKFTRAAEDKPKEGMFIGKYVLHPLTKEKIPIYIANFVLMDYGTGIVMAVPAHDTRDHAFAIKHKLPIKQVIMPVYGEPHQEEEYRKTVSAIVYRNGKRGKEFLALKWKQFNWVSIPIGGIDEDESVKHAAEREVLEETGYVCRAIELLGGEIESHFFAENKNVWRHRLDQPVLLEVVDDQPRRVAVEEAKKHEAMWLSAEELLQKMTHEYNAIGLQRYLSGTYAYTGTGKLVNSGEFDGLANEEAKKVITQKLHSLARGNFTTQYKIRDWLISRQRYWGTPIPMVYCEHCGVVPVAEHDLPILLPGDVQFTGEGNPLKTSSSFINTKCPKCAKPARRETDTMDTFFDSSWYFLRFCSPHESQHAFDSEIANRIMPIDQYIGGAEHAVMHLLYARFFTRVLHDMGLVKCKEPFKKLFNQGMVTKDGAKMSKSYGNVVTQDDIAEKYGIDTARFFLMFVSSPESELEWNDEGVAGAYRFILRFFSLVEKYCAQQGNITAGNSDAGVKDAFIESKRNAAIRDVTKHIDDFALNKALLVIMDLANETIKCQEQLCMLQLRSTIETLALLLAPFTPHLSEEIWEMIGRYEQDGFISLYAWPVFDASRIDAKIEDNASFVEETISGVRKSLQQKNLVPTRIELFAAEQWKYDFVVAFREAFASIKNPKDLAAAIVQKVSYNEDDVTKLCFAVYKNQKLLPMVDRTREEELVLLDEIVGRLGAEFNCEVALCVDVATSSDPKARNGLPSKPAISLS